MDSAGALSVVFAWEKASEGKGKAACIPDICLCCDDDTETQATIHLHNICLDVIHLLTEKLKEFGHVGVSSTNIKADWRELIKTPGLQCIFG